MNNSTLNEVPLFKHFLVSSSLQTYKWNSSIQSIAKNAGKMVGIFYRYRKYLNPSMLLSLQMSDKTKTGVLHSHMWAGAAQTSLHTLDNLKKNLIF